MSIARDAPGGAAEDAAHRVITGLGRDARARILSALARRFGDLDLAEDMMQEALLQALQVWPQAGIPDSPEAWLMTTARHRGIDALRRRSVLRQKLPRLRVEQERALVPQALDDPAAVVGDEHDLIHDDRLGLFFACAHPLLSPEDRIALTLRFLGGLSTTEVAHALLRPVPTMQQRIVRAKRRIRTLGIAFGVPRRDDLPERLAGVQRVIYLLYAEGFTRSEGTTHTREDLTAEAVRLARVLRELMPGSAETAGLLGLLLLTQARRPARTDDDGRPVPLAEQDRTRWDRQLIDEGITLTESAVAAPGAGPYAIQAAIAAVHAEAAGWDTTDWAQIAVLYQLLQTHDDGPVVRLAGAVAHGRAHGMDAGLRRLDALAAEPALDRFRPFHIARALTLQELGEPHDAAAAYRRALELPGNEAEGEYLAAALAGLEDQRD
ncbi:RNA polymerase sigma factor [Nesterenkonia xinjiangensis]|uniref:RNA polymerase sigma-70 factor (ECF subfamily) n=1 Tax=Nesterenkonia xinjiangensis TaxID=225327 RepID=A0A7Z0GLY6_9MICC|nr:RNA polymerase sigma-70 factor (ECF subfamily) [Nesterenkonia xinjiangensis]